MVDHRTRRGALIISVPHAGLVIPHALSEAYLSFEMAPSDADFHVDRLYAFARDLDATVIRTAICRAVIDVNRDPSGASLYPGRATTELCPTTGFDGAPLYRDDRAPDQIEITRRRSAYFDPYHPRWQPRSRACGDEAPSFFMTRTQFAAASHACSKANCRFSISAVSTAPAAQRR